MIGTQPVELRALVERLDDARRASPGIAAPDATRLASAVGDSRTSCAATSGYERRLSMRHSSSLLVGPTGAGKSTIFNTLAGHAASPVGVLRPTTRVAVVLVHPDDRQALIDGAFAGIPPASFGSSRTTRWSAVSRSWMPRTSTRSSMRIGRSLTARGGRGPVLLRHAATRYADRVPWAVLVARAGARTAPPRRRQQDAARCRPTARTSWPTSAASSRTPAWTTSWRPSRTGRRASSIAVGEGDLAHDGDRLASRHDPAAPRRDRPTCAPGATPDVSCRPRPRPGRSRASAKPGPDRRRRRARGDRRGGAAAHGGSRRTSRA